MIPCRVSATAVKSRDIGAVALMVTTGPEFGKAVVVAVIGLSARNDSASSATTRSTTDAQSPRVCWRNKRIVGYHGLSSRSRSQRQSDGVGINVQTGLP